MGDRLQKVKAHLRLAIYAQKAIRQPRERHVVQYKQVIISKIMKLKLVHVRAYANLVILINMQMSPSESELRQRINNPCTEGN